MQQKYDVIATKALALLLSGIAPQYAFEKAFVECGITSREERTVVSYDLWDIEEINGVPGTGHRYAYDLLVYWQRIADSVHRMGRTLAKENARYDWRISRSLPGSSFFIYLYLT